MKIGRRGLIVMFAFSMFFITLFLSFSMVVNNPKFFQKAWEKENVYEQMNISEEELTKVIVHTMDYMWDKNNDLQITVTLKDGTTREFYKNYGESYDGTIMDELAHMEECKRLFMGFKSIFILSIITGTVSLYGLIQNRKSLEKVDTNSFFIAYAIPIVLVGLIGLYAAIDFDSLFINFHKIFFAGSNISWSFPANSFMIIMLPENAIFENVVIYTIIYFAILSLVINGLVIFARTILIEEKA